ncbi:MAG TPA: FliH/SctL family protein [Bacillota bacterium]|nr:FliH/SctL family protein [Bacillota bacterium]
MSLSYKIIKSAEIRDSLQQVLPLRRYMPEKEPALFKTEKNDPGPARLALESWAVAQAEEIVNRARSTADEIIRQVRLEAEKIKQEAYEKGFAEGRGEGAEKGYREGMEQAREEADLIRGQAREVLDQAEQFRRRTMEEMGQEIIDLAREIAERLLSAQLTLDPEIVVNIAAESIRLVSDRRNVILYISPDEQALFESKKDELRGILPAGAKLTVVVDRAIRPGGCKVETEQGKVDATMEKRMEELFKALYGRSVTTG